MQVLIIGLILLANYCDGFIAPVEIHRLNENILILPNIFKGTDSRRGFGFRLGNHADFQSIFEIGPQKFTKPLGTCQADKRTEDGFSISIKRMVNDHGDVTKTSKPKSSSVEYYHKKSFSKRDQYPLPKLLKNEKLFLSMNSRKLISRRKQLTRRMAPKITQKPMTLDLRRNSKYLKEEQLNKLNSKEVDNS